LRQAVEDAQRASDRCEPAESAVAALTRQRGAAEQRDALDTAAAEARDLLRDAVDFAQVCKAAWLDARAARIQGMASELAAELVDGEACPVCGSDQHPTPARDGASPITRQDEEAAERDAAVADEARAMVEAGLADIIRQRAVADATAGTIPLAEINEALSKAERDLIRLRTKADGIQQARDDLATFETEADKRAQEQLRLDALQLTSSERATHEQGRLQRLQSRLDAARGEDPSVTARKKRLAALVGHLAGLVDAVAAVDRLAGEVTAARHRAARAAEQHGLDDLDDVIANSRPEPVVLELEEFRRRHDEEFAALKEMLAEPATVAAMSTTAPDLPALTDAAERSERTVSEHAALLVAGRYQATQLGTLQQHLVDLLALREPLAAEHQTVDALAKLAEGKSGDNRLKMSLSGYVLAARLEQVAAAASERLERMSSGRYRLAHAAAGGNARERGGLNLRVLDAWTGADRDPATLSGGETFSASLALALGLADVVTAEAGGSLLDTLFVDEGFGTLDDDTLDEVMGVLDELREGGRVVGVVSHVADLRQRIPVQLQVDKGRAGSIVRQ
jgi:exonuclease SbcC